MRGRGVLDTPPSRGMTGACRLAQLAGSLARRFQPFFPRLIDGFAKKMADSFFENFQTAVEPPAQPHPEPVEEAVAEKKPGWFRRLVGKKT